MSEPKIVQKRAIDVTPGRHGVWCSIGSGEPFTNPIVGRRWSEDGAVIWFMLDSHNFDRAAPEDMMDVVEILPLYGPDVMAQLESDDREKMRVRPMAHAFSPDERTILAALAALPPDRRERVLAAARRTP